MKEPIQLSAMISEEMAGLRLDYALSLLFTQYSRTLLQQWIKKGAVTVDGQSPKLRQKVLGGEQISVQAELELQGEWQAEAMDLHIIHEDPHILVLDKPANLVVHPAPGHYQGTLLNGLLHHVDTQATIPRAGIVHRLDKDTSGVMVVAKTLEAHRSLVNQIHDRQVKRDYVAVVTGIIISGGHIDQPIGRHPQQRKKMAVVKGGREAVSHYRVLEKFNSHTYVSVQLETGRTHQIRVHMAFLRHPVVGDGLYAGRFQASKHSSPLLNEMLRNFSRQALHAKCLSFQHPASDEQVQFSSPVPTDIVGLLQGLRGEGT